MFNGYSKVDSLLYRICFQQCRNQKILFCLNNWIHNILLSLLLTHQICREICAYSWKKTWVLYLKMECLITSEIKWITLIPHLTLLTLFTALNIEPEMYVSWSFRINSNKSSVRWHFMCLLNYYRLMRYLPHPSSNFWLQQHHHPWNDTALESVGEKWLSSN